MRQVTAAKRGGSSHLLYPAGMGSIEEIPADLALAIEQALRVSMWQENLSEEEMPPQWMWHLEWELEDWFAEVDRKRKEKFGGDEAADDANMMGNDLARERFGR